MRQRVIKARNIALDRFRADGEAIFSNAAMESSHIRKYCNLSDAAASLLKNAFDRLGLSGRGYDRILRVARTIADLDEYDIIRREHIFEALRFKNISLE